MEGNDHKRSALELKGAVKGIFFKFLCKLAHKIFGENLDVLNYILTPIPLHFYHMWLNQQMHNINLLYKLNYYIIVHIVRSNMFRRQCVITREVQTPDTHSSNTNTIVYTATTKTLLQISVLRTVYILHFCILYVLSI